MEKNKKVLDMSNISFETEGNPISNYLKWLDKGELITGVDYQRSFVWSEWKQTNLALSVLIGIRIPSIEVYRTVKGLKIKNIHDGKQRIITLQRTVNNCYKFDTSKFPFEYFTINGEVYAKEDLNGLTFGELSPELQELFLDRNFKMEITSGIDDDIAEGIFTLYNMGAEALKPQEIRLASMGRKTRQFFNTIKELPVFNHAAISDKQKINNLQHDIIAQTALLLNFNTGCELSGDNVSGFINQYRDTGLPEELSNRLLDSFNYLSTVTNLLVMDKENNSTGKGKKKKEGSATKITFLNKTNIVMLAVEADKAKQNGILEAEFTQIVVDFFKNLPSDYKNASSSKTASESQVKIRMESIAKGFTKSVNNAIPSTPKLTIVKKVIPENVSIYDNEDFCMSNNDIPQNVMDAVQGSY
ncbi:MAG TPA: hypothetical protein DEG71_02230 [Clostridiales bacterium]|nr:hypothetical protein [Clostridiales bacterium]